MAEYCKAKTWWLCGLFSVWVLCFTSVALSDFNGVILIAAIVGLVFYLTLIACAQDESIRRKNDSI